MVDLIFELVNALALVGWVLLATLPRRRWAELLSGWLLPAALAGVYVAIVVATWGRSPGGFASLGDVALLFQSRWLLLAGWVHYLAFDLFVGGWIVRDARARGIAHRWLFPSLLSTFLFGPAGWLSYLGLRAALRWRAAPARPAAPWAPPSSGGYAAAHAQGPREQRRQRADDAQHERDHAPPRARQR